MQPRLTTTISILSLSTVTGITTVITGIIPQLKRTFPTVPTTLIEWLVTIANCSALITLLLNPRLTSRWGLRPIVISGLLISAIMGLIPAITTNFTVIMVSRLGLGLGVGLFSPHAISLLTHSFTGDLRARLLGYQTGLSALGNAILLGLAGLLISLSWHAVFWLYGLLVIVAGGVAWFVPEPTVPSTTTNHARTEKTQLPRHQWTLLGLTFITYLLIWGVQLKLPSYFSARHFGNAAHYQLNLSSHEHRWLAGWSHLWLSIPLFTPVHLNLRLCRSSYFSLSIMVGIQCNCGYWRCRIFQLYLLVHRAIFGLH
ncbi:MFS transporter [Lactiplantibacillus plantarum]|uniref:MFS transporter n=1 Tax=Lactiplantibacillus plantarum TaxID=1590 RepID=UPI0022B96B80|nr:MFS transporter [Lactiplantibacillus plantarum]WBF40506.1 MFS transporter [Lactiplantibacillus plantarum]